MIDGGLRARLACIDTRKLDAGFAGREFDRALLRDLPASIDPCGERGEFHSCVYAGPMFEEAVALEAGETHTVAPFVWADLKVGLHD
jgi:diphthamide synthase (EF-2-diphthine--ammonia ligase)